MSNQRRAGIFHPYRLEYLHSGRGSRAVPAGSPSSAATGQPLVCVGVRRAATPSRSSSCTTCDYAGVHLNAGVWTAAEPHEDLDADAPVLPRAAAPPASTGTLVLARHRTRRDATYQALQRLRLQAAGDRRGHRERRQQSRPTSTG